MQKFVYNPTETFGGCRFSHGKADMQQIVSNFDPADEDQDWSFVSGESNVIRGGAVVVVGDSMLIAHVDFLPGEAVELAYHGGVYEMPVDAAIDEQTPVFLKAVGSNPVTGLQLSATEGALPAAGMLQTNLSAGEAGSIGEFSRV